MNKYIRKLTNFSNNKWMFIEKTLIGKIIRIMRSRKKTSYFKADPLAEEVFFIDKKNAKTQKKMCILSCFSKNCKINEWQMYLIKSLFNQFGKLIIIFDNPIIPKELDKIKKYSIFVQCKRHNEYDFGSYKIGYFFLKENDLLNIDQLVILNDSCFGPIFDLSNMMKIMENKRVNFWGITINNEYKEHIQSYFIVFDKKVIKSNLLYIFLKKVKHRKSSFEVILSYEIKLTKYISKHKFTYSSYIPKQYNNNIFNIHPNKTYFPALLIKEFKCPFIKIKEFTNYYSFYDCRKKTMDLIKLYNITLYRTIINYLSENNINLDFEK